MRIWALLGALLLATWPAAVVGQNQEPIKIGVLLPLTGPASTIGNEDLQGFKYVIEAAGSTAAGRKIELITVDDQNSPTVALNEARRLVETEKVTALVGNLNGPIALALSAYALRMKVPYLTGSTASDLTESKKNAYTFRGSSEAFQFHAPLGEFLKRRGFKAGILMGSDYVTGHDTVDGVANGFKKNGGTVLKTSFPRLGESDYAPYFADLGQLKADFLYGFFFGGDSFRFVRAYRASGLKFPLVVTGSSISVGDVAQRLGNDIEGILSNENWIWTLTDPTSKAFIDGYTAKYHETPGTIAVLGYDQGMVMLQAIRALRGNVPDGTAMAGAMRRVRFTAPGGQEFRFDENQNPIIAEYLVQWSFKDGKVTPKVLDVVRNIKQEYSGG
jgi:branched-chain amino acid transport system substrate-binding protein